MGIKRIRLQVSQVFEKNYFFMMLISLIFGYVSWSQTPADQYLFSYTTDQLLWKGFVFLFIFFACELSKGLLQKEKSNKRIEWLLGNNVKLGGILWDHSLTLWFVTMLLLLPMLLGTLIFTGIPEAATVIDFLITTFWYCIIGNELILLTANMNHFRRIPILLSLLGFVLLGTEIFLSVNFKTILVGAGMRYLLTLIVIGIFRRMCSNERVVSAYF